MFSLDLNFNILFDHSIIIYYYNTLEILECVGRMKQPEHVHKLNIIYYCKLYTYVCVCVCVC